MKKTIYGMGVYWRFKGEQPYRHGYPTDMRNGLVCMGRWKGDDASGVIVNLDDIEIWRK